MVVHSTTKGGGWHPSRVRHPTKTFGEAELERVLRYIERRARVPKSAQATVLFSYRAGLTPFEIVALTTEDIFELSGDIKPKLAAGTGKFRNPLRRQIPWHPQLLDAVNCFYQAFPAAEGVAFTQTAKGRLCYQSGLNLHTWFGNTYRAAGLYGCTAASGRYSFAAGLFDVAATAGISIRDIQSLLGYAGLGATSARDQRGRPFDDVIRQL